MTDAPNRVHARLSVIANLAGRPLSELHRLSRLPDAPRRVDHVGGVPVYDLEKWMDWLHPTDPAPEDPSKVLDLTQSGVERA